MLDIFKWGCGSGSKGVAFWGWAEDMAGRGSRTSTLVAAVGTMTCSTDEKIYDTVIRTNGQARCEPSAGGVIKRLPDERQVRAFVHDAAGRKGICSLGRPGGQADGISVSHEEGRGRAIRHGQAPAVVVLPETR